MISFGWKVHGVCNDAVIVNNRPMANGLKTTQASEKRFSANYHPQSVFIAKIAYLIREGRSLVL
jgi:hypothetical protein